MAMINAPGLVTSKHTQLRSTGRSIVSTGLGRFQCLCIRPSIFVGKLENFWITWNIPPGLASCSSNTFPISLYTTRVRRLKRVPMTQEYARIRRSIIRSVVRLEDELFKSIRRCSKSDLQMWIATIEVRVEAHMRTSNLKETVWGNQLMRCLRRLDLDHRSHAGQCLRTFRKRWMDDHRNRDTSSVGSMKTDSSSIVHASVCRKSTRGALRVLDPRTNFREILKNAMLLDDHLRDKGKRCADCIHKHTILIEAYLEEAYSLDKKETFRALCDRLRICLEKLWKMVSHRSTYPEAIETVHRMITATQIFAEPRLRDPTK